MALCRSSVLSSVGLIAIQVSTTTRLSTWTHPPVAHTLSIASVRWTLSVVSTNIHSIQPIDFEIWSHLMMMISVYSFVLPWISSLGWNMSWLLPRVFQTSREASPSKHLDHRRSLWLNSPRQAPDHYPPHVSVELTVKDTALVNVDTQPIKI